MKKKINLIICLVLLVAMLTAYGCKPNPTTPTPGVETPIVQPTPTPVEGIVDVPGLVSPFPTGDVSASPSPTVTPTVGPVTKPPAEQVADDSVKIGPSKPINKPGADYKFKYFLEVDLNNQCVNVYNLYTETLKADGTIYRNTFAEPQLVDRFICSSGLNNSTPKGVFYVPEPGKKGYSINKFTWGYFQKYDCWARYLTRIDGAILFHSIVFDKRDPKTARTGSYYNLGSKASHGCIRLTVEHARWIHDNCPIGTMVSITDKQPTSKELKAYLKEHLPKYGVAITPRPDVGATPAPTYTPTVTVTPEVTVTPAVTATPTKKPTKKPTATPAVTPEPTEEPTEVPTEAPTATPTPEASAEPTEEPLV